MSGDEKVVADFTGRYAKNPKSNIGEEPDSGRIVMSKKRLVVAGNGERITIPLSTVVDVVVGNVPQHLRDLFEAAVTIGYTSDDSPVETVLIEGNTETIERFRNVLFKTLLNGTKAEVQHPARVGGRVTDTEVRKAKLAVSADRVRFKTASGTFEIHIRDVVGFERTERAPDGTARPTLLVRHADEGEMKTTLVAPLSTRRLNLLGRFLRIEYGALLEEVADIELNEPEKRLLVAVYATGGDIDFANVLDGDAARATNVLNTLRDKGLLEDGPNGVSLTAQGRVVVNQRIEDVNI